MITVTQEYIDYIVSIGDKSLLDITEDESNKAQLGTCVPRQCLFIATQTLETLKGNWEVLTDVQLLDIIDNLAHILKLSINYFPEAVGDLYPVIVPVVQFFEATLSVDSTTVTEAEIKVNVTGYNQGDIPKVETFTVGGTAVEGVDYSFGFSSPLVLTQSLSLYAYNEIIKLITIEPTAAGKNIILGLRNPTNCSLGPIANITITFT
jgi:hypothetical protein